MAKISDVVSGSIFLTQERALKKILQNRERGDLAKARQHALEGLEKWPNDYDLAMEAIQASLDLSDYPQAANLLKTAHRRHGSRRDEIMEYARSAFAHSSSTLIGGFIVDVLQKSRNLEAIADLVRGAPESFLTDIVKRCETRARNLAAEGQERSALAGENALLLGVLYRESRSFEKAVGMLGAAIEVLPGDAQPIGEALLQIESELPGSAAATFYLGLASLLLEHPEKAEARFFQCMERSDPPVENILAAIEGRIASLPNGQLLRGEALMRAERVEEGAAAMRGYIDGGPETAAEGEQAPRIERCRRAASRLTLLPADVFTEPAAAFLYAEAAAATGSMKDAVGALEESLARDSSRSEAVIAWLEARESESPTAPGERLLSRLYVEAGRIDDAVRAARIAAEADQSAVPALVESLKALTAPPRGREPKLLMLLAELRARLCDREGAEEILGELRRGGGLHEDELARLAGEIIRHCGATLATVVSAFDIALGRGAIDEAAAHVRAFCREKRDEHEALAAEFRDLAAEDEGRWALVARLLDEMAAEEELSQPLRLLQATAHLWSGEIERAVFEFDQLMMFDDGLRRALIDTYRRALARHDSSAMLHLALFHLFRDEGSLGEASRHLCRTLELDPGQIRDIMHQFEKLVESEPGNARIWEEMLRTAVAMHRTTLAKEIMGRAVAALPAAAAAGLHLHGARIAAAEGAWEDALRCLAIALRGESPDIRAIETELCAFIERDPREARAHFLLGEALIRLGRERDGTLAFRRSLERAPDLAPSVREALERLLPLSVEPWMPAGLLGEILWFDGDREGALRLFASAQSGPRESLAGLSVSLEKIRTAAPDDASLALMHARTLALEERYAESVLLQATLLDRDAGMDRDVADILQTIVAARPSQPDANALLARMSLAAGDRDRSREALLRLMADDTADAGELARVVEPFLADHGADGPVLVHYGALKARAGAFEEAIERLRAALDRDPSLAEDVLSALESAGWPQRCARAKSLLAADCLTAAGRADEAFSIISGFAEPDAVFVDELVPRIAALAGREPRREHFSLGATLLAGAGRLDEAESFIERGKMVLPGDERIDLTIELAELLHGANETERAGRMFEEALARAADRSPIYGRIERSYLAWVDRMIDSLSARVGSAPAFAGAIELLVDLLVERGRGAEAFDAIGRSAAAPAVRKLLLGRVYLSMDRPLLACAALAGVGSLDDDRKQDLMYLEGIARERAGDHGRAAAIFAAIAAGNGAHGDCRERAMRNYGAFIAEWCHEPAAVIEKTDSV